MLTKCGGKKNGFLSALDRHGNLLTWSNLTGKLLYSEKFENLKDKLKGYDVYSADVDDITYMRDFYNLHDRSLSLLKSKYDVEVPSKEEVIFQKRSGKQKFL